MTSTMQEAAGQKPVPSVNPAVNPQAAGPVLPSPPHPVLQSAGFAWGGIDEFNKRIQGVVDAYQQVHGDRPPAGLALDVARSKVQPVDYGKLFKSHAISQYDSQLVATVNQHQRQNPQQFLATRYDGVQQPISNVLQLVQKSHPEAGFLANTQAQAPPPVPLAQFLKKYPMVTMGVLPIPSFKDLETALAKINQPVPTVHPLPGMVNVTQAQLQVEAQQEQFRADAPYVRTLRQAQTELNKAMGTHLPTTGIFNQTWIDALHNWMKTTNYAQQELAYQAQQNNMSVDAYVKAYNQRDRVRQQGLWGWLLGNMPLPLYGHGGLWQDIASVPSYLVGGSGNPLDIGLHALTRSAGLTLDVVGGTVSQAQADLAATSAAAYQIWKHGWGHPGTYEEALAAARQQIHANPSWLRAFGFGQVPVNEGKWLRKIDEISNVIVSLVLLRKPSLTGERIAAGDVAAAERSDYITASSKWAYQQLQKYGQDGIGRAAARLEGGKGGQALVGQLAKAVQSGEITQEQFRSYVSDLFTHGHTDINGKTISGPLLDSLRSDKVPTPGKFGRGWIGVKGAVRQWSDNHLYSYNTAVGSAAKSFAQSLRNAVYHYIPPRLGYFDEILPERVFNFILKHKLGDAALANRLESIVVKAQGADNAPRIQQVEQKIKDLYFEKYKASLPTDQTPFKPLLSTEAPSIFEFPTGGKKEITGTLSAIAANTESLNAALNKLAQMHARVILSGLPFFGPTPLFWKHSIGDTLRSWVGGGLFTSPGIRAAKAEINALADSDVEVSRWLGKFRDQTRNSEATWAMGRGGNTLRRDFTTSEYFKSDQYMTAAGGFLRRALDDPALAAFESHDPKEMVDLVQHNSTYLGMWRKASGQNPELTIQDYARLVWERYKHIGDALAAQGLTFKDLQSVYNEYRGAKVDAQLGQWIKQHKLNFDVTSGQVEQVGSFDSWTGKWVGDVIMRPNKWNRGNFGENVLAQTYSSLRKGGWDQKEALQTSISVSSALTKYHMLDFANRLQIEQNLRWISYFATKHRLYWKWVIGTFLRHPGYAAATYEFKDTLDKQGGWTLPFRMFGLKWDVPLERLVWVPGREYDETSPLASAVFNLIASGGDLGQVAKVLQGNTGNVITRSDVTIKLGTKLMKIELGGAAPTYGYAVAGLDPTTSKFVTKALNEYQITFMLEHGHYDLESNAVKKVLLAQMGEEYWRANLPLPIVPDQGRTTEQQQLMDQFMKIDDPLKRSQFLQSHQQLGDLFGVYTDPKLELHNKYFFGRWAQIIDAYRAARSSLYDSLRDDPRSAKNTLLVEKQRRALNANLNATRNKLLIEDAQMWGINTKGMVPDGQTVPFGPWGRLVQADPVFDPTHALHTLFPHLGSISGEIIGPLQRQMQHELAQLNTPYAANSGYTPQEITTRKEELIQKLAVFQSYPSDALGVVRDKYQVMVNQYWAGYKKRYDAGQAAPSGTPQTVADAEFRAWRDSQDHPVVVNGITFPSPVRMAWAMLDPVTRQQRLGYLASKSMGDLANYELDLLGVKHPNWVSNAISAIDQALQNFRDKNPGKHPDIIGTAKAIDKEPGYQGFYAYYVNVLTAPRIRQFMMTNIYRDMPPNVASAFSTISQPALDTIRLIAADKAAGGGNETAYRARWRQIVRQQITPWLNLSSNDALRNYLKPMGKNFLDDLISNGRVG